MWPHLPFAIHRGVLWAFGIALIISLVPLIRIRWPDRAEALRRLEAAAGLPHRPATSYHDTLAGQAQSPATTRIWAGTSRTHVAAFRPAESGLAASARRPRDPFALRALLLLLLASAIIANLDDAGDRIRSAFILKPIALPSSARLDAWITPPLYTGKPPIMLADGSRPKTGEGEPPQTQFTVPEQSELTVRVNHSDAARFSLRIAAQGRRRGAVPIEDGRPLGDRQHRQGQGEYGRIQGKAGRGRWKSSCSTMARGWHAGVSIPSRIRPPSLR